MLHYFKDFLLKSFLSSSAFSKYCHLYYIRSPQWYRLMARVYSSPYTRISPVPVFLVPDPSLNQSFKWLFPVYFDASDSCHNVLLNFGQWSNDNTIPTTRQVSIKVHLYVFRYNGYQSLHILIFWASEYAVEGVLFWSYLNPWGKMIFEVFGTLFTFLVLTLEVLWIFPKLVLFQPICPNSTQPHQNCKSMEKIYKASRVNRVPNTSKIILPHGFKYDQNKTPSSLQFTLVIYTWSCPLTCF